MLRGCPGVASNADDHIIHGKGVEEHDRFLFAVLDRLNKVGLTLERPINHRNSLNFLLAS